MIPTCILELALVNSDTAIKSIKNTYLKNFPNSTYLADKN